VSSRIWVSSAGRCDEKHSPDAAENRQTNPARQQLLPGLPKPMLSRMNTLSSSRKGTVIFRPYRS
jgi:hypothetical protein